MHGVVTLAAAGVLAVFPAAIPATVGIAMEAQHMLLSYFLAAVELAVAFLSIRAARLEDAAAVRAIAMSFVIFHLATAVLEAVYLASAGMSAVLVANIVVRIGAAAVFVVVWRGRR